MTRSFCLAFAISVIALALGDVDSPYRFPTKCEVCKILTMELKDRLATSGRNKEAFHLGYGLDDSKKKKVNYAKSELRLIEAIHEPHICDEVKQYNVHAERKGSLRYAKGRSETMNTLHGLKDRGVKVELGIPYELWDAPNAEVGQMTRECYGIIEDYEDNIEEWYFGDQAEDLEKLLCKELVLDRSDTECLDEVWTGEERIDGSKEEEERNVNSDSKEDNNDPNDNKDEL